ncbi:septin-5 isoform X1 [Xenopus laevis]|uniref:Septin-5 isoform X1 n=1 Tax=Xenopus laevis TaxID=8355 RepID=A0A8J0UCT0_XENLA|nr:septin-5 isoform X1 [Xenopus laevis]
MERSSSEETYSEAEDESQFQHFLRNDSEAELAGIIKGIGFDGSLHIEENSQSDQEQEKEDWLHNRQQQECGRIYNEHLEEERQNRRGQQQQEEESLCKEHQEEEILFREDQGGNLIRKQHENVRLHRDQFDEEERLRREYQEEKIRGEQYEEERLRREHQQDARLCSEQQEQKLRKQHLEEVERIRRDHLRQPQAQHEDKRTIKEKFSQVDSDILPNMIRHIKEDVEEEDSWEDEDSSHSLTVLPTKLCCPQALTPLSPSRPKSPWGRFDPYDSFEEDREYVGFATLPNQMHRKYVKKGFEFTLMVAGESGLGKSTLINSLFLTDLYRDRHILSPEERVTQTVEIVKQTVDIQEKGVRLHLTIVDTPGYGDAINNESCWKPAADYIDQQFEQYFRDESGLNRRNLQDTRVHCCLYFLSPLGHGMRPMDIEFLRALQDKVNIVPILGKADSLTPTELQQKKQRIRDEIEKYGIRIYQFPECDSDEDEDFKQQDIQLKKSIPFAVIGANTIIEVNGRRVRGRMYPWGVVEVENEEHCDFIKLRTMLIRTHMQDLKDVTRETHYENYRAQCIQNLTQRVVRERNRNKLTRESGTDFPIPSMPPSPDHETQRLIREKDEELRRMHEVLQKMQRQIKDSQ